MLSPLFQIEVPSEVIEEGRASVIRDLIANEIATNEDLWLLRHLLTNAYECCAGKTDGTEFELSARFDAAGWMPQTSRREGA